MFCFVAQTVPGSAEVGETGMASVIRTQSPESNNSIMTRGGRDIQVSGAHRWGQGRHSRGRRVHLKPARRTWTTQCVRGSEWHPGRGGAVGHLTGTCRAQRCPQRSSGRPLTPALLPTRTSWLVAGPGEQALLHTKGDNACYQAMSHEYIHWSPG